MSCIYKPIDLTKLKTYSLFDRKSKVSVTDFAKPWQKGATFKNFLDSLPDILAGDQIQKVISSITSAVKNKKTIVFAMGAHVIKVGLNPIVIDLINRNVISSVAMNGAGIIHDLEIAMAGQTSEDVSESIEDGSFGMAHETCTFLCDAINKAQDESIGLGEAVGRFIIEKDLPYKDKSILATCSKKGIPATIHIAIGTDIIHMHAKFDPMKAGGATHKDFRTFASVITTLNKGVYLNVGSAVILPEIFLKAVTLVRNLGYFLEDFTTVNMDFIKHYRPVANVVNRPTAKGGQGINLIGHHEIMLPIIAAGVIEQI